MAALGRLRALRRHLVAAAAAAAEGEEVVCIVWRIGDDPRSIQEAVQTAMSGQNIQSIGPVRMHIWSDEALAVLSAERRGGESDLSPEDAAKGRAELETMLGKAVAWLGAPLRDWSAVKAIVGGSGWPASLRYIHNTFTGVDMIAAAEPPPEIIVTNMRGRFDYPIAEFVLTWMLMACKQMVTLLQQQADASWPELPAKWEEGGTTRLRGRVVAIIGLGSIGSTMAELFKAMGMRVLGLRRTASPGEAPPPNVDTLYTTEQLSEALAEADFVVLATPATPQTEGMIGRDELAVMQPHASLMNIARGSVAVWDDVLEALREGQIGAYYTVSRAITASIWVAFF